ncbi:multidrug effflux MFS transporter [Telluria aromaticivorans]|uniref:Bcr/CflA family efflux transporter n=1 Tax=Telluria aromaticivorans TaxID=2725995 RepID=A0A7Y2JW31_9BURK|nr:multidrug effflux MFS transporter [Telluria aromaticivorans]NNG21453.1 multidrug effflux MFS transporter [Telluria aromaticivorans]
MPGQPETTPGPIASQASRRTILLLLGGLALLGPLSVDFYLPAFSSIAHSMQVGPAQVQYTLTAYLFSYAVLSLWHGALSDTFGRRKVVIVSLVLFGVASLGCALAPDIGALSVFRMLQGVAAGAGTVIGRAIIRDLYEGAPAARMLSMVSMIFAISPAFAPILGGWVVTAFEWRAIFYALALYTVTLLWFCMRYLPETLAPGERQSLAPAKLFRNYAKVFLSVGFQRGAGAIAVNFAGLFLTVAAAPLVLGEHLGLSANQFGWHFVPMVGGIFLGSLAADRLAGKFGLQRQIGIGFAVMLAGAGANLLYHAVLPPALPWSVAPIFFYASGMSLAAPGLTLTVLDLFPDVRGVVASMQSFSMVMLTAIVTAVAAPALQHSMFYLALGQLAFGLAGLVLWLPGLARRSLPPP